MRNEYVPYLYGNLVAAVDVETTALDPKKGEICQLAVVPVDANWYPSEKYPHFKTYIKPLKPENYDPISMKIHGITQAQLDEAPEPERAVGMLIEWFEGLMLPVNKCLIPLAHNYPYEHMHLPSLLGFKLANRIFHGHYRDGMEFALGINDKYALAGEPTPFKKVGLEAVCQYFNVVNEKPHDAYYDCIAEIHAYRNLLQFDI